MPTTEVDNSFLQTMDIGLRGLLFTKYHDILNLDTIADGVELYPREIALRKMAEKRGQPEVEFINVWRTRVAPDWNRQRTPAARRGMMMEYVDAETMTDIATIRAVPVNLEYNVWFWTHYQERINQIVERYLFWQHDDPNLNLDYVVKYDNTEYEYPTELDLHFGELVDESTIKEEYDKGQIFILQTPITIDGWVFIATTTKTALSIIFTAYDKDDLNSAAEYEEIVVEGSDQNTELEVVLKLFTRTYTS
jgi:hypothetical protein